MINQKVVSYTLQHRGAEVIMVNNGREAVDALRQNQFDIVLMDMQMPEMDGYEATRRIRSDLSLDIPVIAMTANAIKGEAEKCFAAGVNSFVSKPFNQQELLREIVRLTTGQQSDLPNNQQNDTLVVEGNNGILDLSYVRELAGGKKDYVNQVLSIFMDNTPPGLKELERLIQETEDWEQISRQAHFLKSSVSIVKIQGMQERLQQIELLAKEGQDMATIRQLLRELTTTFAAAELLIRKELGELG